MEHEKSEGVGNVSLEEEGTRKGNNRYLQVWIAGGRDIFLTECLKRLVQTIGRRVGRFGFSIR